MHSLFAHRSADFLPRSCQKLSDAVTLNPPRNRVRMGARCLFGSVPVFTFYSSSHSITIPKVPVSDKPQKQKYNLESTVLVSEPQRFLISRSQVEETVLPSSSKDIRPSLTVLPLKLCCMVFFAMRREDNMPALN